MVHMKPVNHRRETRIAKFSLIMTVGLYYLLADHLAHKIYDSYFFPNPGPFYGGLVYMAALSIVFYSVVHYHVCLIGNYKRHRREQLPTLEKVAEIYDKPAPSMAVIIPSYKEEYSIMLQTMLSAAVSEYPAKNVVLLIDNPQNPKTAADRALMEQARALPETLNKQFTQQAEIFHNARDEYFARKKADHSNAADEIQTLAMLYEKAAEWFEAEALNLADNQPLETLAGDTRFFIETIILKPAQLHREKAAELRKSDELSDIEIARHYNRLAGFFTVTFSSFERKRYVNLSHDANKAMNLNCYMMLIGRRWKEVQTEKGLELHECAENETESFAIPAADYVNTIDADSLMTHDYIARLVYFLEQPEHSKVAVAQSPCSATPGFRSAVERIASASIDVQFHTHQGYTYWDASFWVGANAMLRTKALEAIKEIHDKDGKMITVYIQDRTLIEDTESSIDLVHKGWKLYNYPKRMTYSASPSDFGSLLIQRRRWANGGLIILPKLIRYAFRAPKDVRLAKEIFMRFNYLAMTSLSVAMLLVYSFYTFSPRLSTPLLLYANLPYLLLFARDLKICGYRYTDALRVCAFNLMLLPVIAAGVLKQMQQIFTGRKIPFGRTPKVKGRTGAPAIYYILEIALIVHFYNRVVEEIGEQHWGQAVFAGVNFAFLLYALIYFIGLRPLLQDLSAALLSPVIRPKEPVVATTEVEAKSMESK
jgi:cellulose synthase/poly-beta-1,6-N-acetylglucosamine synthase-like glycosyltransferase